MEESKQVPAEFPNYEIPTKIRIGHSKVHYRGVFATDDIKKGELIERCPMVLMAHRMNYHKDPTIWGYMYTHSCPCEECKRHGGHFLMVMGWGQIYNHQDENNAHISFNLKNSTSDITALKDIKKDEEIFVNYGPNYFSNRKKVNVNETEPMNVANSDSCTTQVFKPL
jgi:hypothetical protein